MSVHTSRFAVPLQDPCGLSVARVEKQYPTLLQRHAHESRSGQYNFFPSWALWRLFGQHGFSLTFVAQARTKDKEMRPYTKHWMHFRQNDQLGTDRQKLGDEVTEIWALNSHGGQSALEIRLALLRLVCLNGAVRTVAADFMKVLHRGNPWEEVMPAAQKMVARSTDILQWASLLKDIHLDAPEVLLLQQAAIAARLETDLDHSQVIDGQFRVLENYPLTGEKRIASIYPVESFTRPRRNEDVTDSNTIWMQTQIMEENMRIGGQNGVHISVVDGKERESRLRGINSIDGQRGLHTIMAQLSEKFVVLKTGKSMAEAVHV